MVATTARSPATLQVHRGSWVDDWLLGNQIGPRNARWTARHDVAETTARWRRVR